MRVDSHQHFWRRHPVRDAWISDEMALLKHDFLLVDLVPELRANSIDVCGGAGRLIRKGNPLSARARLNNLSLMALTISTGFVVDDAIVMIENVARYTNAHHIEHVQCAAPCRRITHSPRDSRKVGINR